MTVGGWVETPDGVARITGLVKVAIQHVTVMAECDNGHLADTGGSTVDATWLLPMGEGRRVAYGWCPRCQTHGYFLLEDEAAVDKDAP